MKSPFEFGSTVSDKSFTNRDVERKRLAVNLTSGINTILISPRRWGKSSLVEKAAKEICTKNKNIRVAFIDLFSISTEEAFLELYARTLIKASSNVASEWLNTAKSAFKKLMPKIVLNTDMGDISFEIDKTEIKKHKDEILNLAETISKEKGIQFIVCIDEFQNIVTYDKDHSFEKAMRSYWQRHKNVSYCLYGSKRHMIADIFNDSSRAFYKFGDVIFLTKIERKEWVKFIVQKFKETKKEISSDQANSIANLAQDHSWYVQQLSHIVWLMTDDKVTNKIIDLAFENTLQSQRPFFQQIIENLSTTQLNLLKAIYQRETQLTSVAIMNKYALGTPNNVSKNIQKMIQDDIVDRTKEEYEFMDPIFWALFGKEVVLN
jgi:uncharacterized protein